MAGIVQKGNMGPRLETVRNMIRNVPDLSCLADIGCDHGKLTCAMLEENEDLRAIATDISGPSLEKAKTLAEKMGLTDRISFRLGDGLTVLRPGEADAVCFCGMGGELIRDCIEGNIEVARNKSRFICQPMRGIEELREYLFSEGFRMLDDRMVQENGKWYQVFSCVFNGEQDAVPACFPAGFYSVGHLAFSLRDPGLKEYTSVRLDELGRQMEQARNTRGEAALAGQIENYKTILERW